MFYNGNSSELRQPLAWNSNSLPDGLGVFPLDPNQTIIQEPGEGMRAG